MENIKKNKNIFLLFFFFLTSFWLGFYISSTIPYFTDKQANNDFFFSQNSQQDFDLDLFWKIYNIVSTQYYWSQNLDKKTLEYGMIQWFISSLWDKFTEFMTPEQNKQFLEALSWDFEWIWAVVEKHELWIIVDRVIKGSPALEYWIIKWDIIVEANGESLQELTVTQAVNFIKWPAGSTVKLKILRAGEDDFLWKEIIRDKVKVPSVDSEIFEEERIWYITLNIFWEETSRDFEKALVDMNHSDIDGIIIDLRDNGGWYLQSAVEILSLFVEKWNVLVKTKYSDIIKNDVYYSKNNGYIFQKKIVVLINENSASASEITAGALREYNKAILVWEKTYWKWSVQEPFEMKDGSSLKLTIGRWYTPKDHSIDQNGIQPDVEVSFLKEDFENKYDRQLQTAKEVLKQFIQFENIGVSVENYEKSQQQNISWASQDIVQE